MPSDILFRSKDDFQVLDGYDGTLYQYRNGKQVNTQRLKKAKDAITITSHNSRYYVCITNQAIQEYDHQFRPLRRIHPPNKKFDPVDIAFYKEHAFVLDNDQHQILKMNATTFSITDQIGKFGFNKRQFRYPFALEISRRGDLYVSEVINTRVQILTPDFKHVDYVGGWGVSAGEFFRPKGIAFHKQGLLVADGYMGVIQWFDSKHKISGIITDENGNIRRYDAPVRIRVYQDTLAVIDYFKKTVTVYTIRD